MKYYLIAGEASGDLHGSNLMKSLKNTDPNAEFRFWGGDLMEKYGGKPVKHYKETAFMGFVKVVFNLRTIAQNLKLCKNDIKNYNPDVIILIDYAGFNLQIAQFAKAHDFKVYYYISPKIWAWKTNRIKKIKKYVDHMFTILPFETPFYQSYNYPVEYVGNPVLDAIAFRSDKEEKFEDYIIANKLESKPIVALLAGSRVQEIKLMLPVMIQVGEKFPDYQFVIAGAPGINATLYHEITGSEKIPVVYNQTYRLLQQSSAALVTSGTATLETALLNVPQVVCYHSNIGDFLFNLGRKLIKVEWISLVNLILGKEAVKEMVQSTFKVELIAEELDRLLNNKDYRDNMLNEYKKLRNILGEPGASERAAKSIYTLISG